VTRRTAVPPAAAFFVLAVVLLAGSAAAVRLPQSDQERPSSPRSAAERNGAEPNGAQRISRRSRRLTVVAAGDIACDPENALFNGGLGVGQWCRAAAVRKVIDRAKPNLVLALGDEQYDNGRLTAFNKSYAKSWGHELWRTRPAPGNHEFQTSNGSGYFDYFGANAGRAGRGWYSFDRGGWHFIALNSNCWATGCREGTREFEWLKADLAASEATCSIAYMHHPLVSSGPHGDDEAHARPLWKLLYRAGVDVVLTGHDHIYERFAQLRPDGSKDVSNGFREFIVGTGGAEHYGIAAVHQYSQVRNTTAFGVLRLRLHESSYDWRFLPAAGATFTDTGSDPCHGAP
jgi:acid phosphatase type 7